ncbi:hypothetical protein [Novosphingobium kaempferiae]|uniref:hypothetical protein n=1 Tax=Novosphingobium kaempferiae TaxID=2896849 RepID=UPI001E409E90|nr:hypothetical protein [Novosphingobium kaempferiae]
MVDRFKAAMATGAPRKVVSLAVQATYSSTSTYVGGVTVQPDDPRIFLLGGKAQKGTSYPSSTAVIGQGRTNGDPTVMSGKGLSEYRSGVNNGFEFTLPANQNEFEAVVFRDGINAPIQLEVDGAFASNQGFDSGWSLNTTFVYAKFALPASSKARRIRITTGWRSFAGLRLPSGATIDPVPTRATPFNLVFQGDSITAGSVATQVIYTWPMQAAYRLGIDNPIIVGVGGSGYLARFPKATGYNFRELWMTFSRQSTAARPTPLSLQAASMIAERWQARRGCRCRMSAMKP